MIKFRPMRRKRQQLSQDVCESLLKKATAGILSVIGDGGYPYGVPISFVYENGSIYMHSALNGHKVDAIAHSDKASFTIIDKDEIKPEKYTTYFRSVICFGKVYFIEREEERLKALHLLGVKYNPGDTSGLQHEIEQLIQNVLLIRFDIEYMSGKEAIELVRGRKTK